MEENKMEELIQLFRNIRYDDIKFTDEKTRYLAFVCQYVLICIKNKCKDKCVRFSSSNEHFNYVKLLEDYYIKVRKVTDVKEICNTISFEIVWNDDEYVINYMEQIRQMILALFNC